MPVPDAIRGRRRTGGLISFMVLSYQKFLYALLACFLLFCSSLYGQELYQLPDSVHTRWTSFENPSGAKGIGGKENQGAKGHPYDQVYAGETVTLLDVKGAGVIKRIWMTINDRDPEMLRSLRFDMYWDNSQKPAVSAPLGDFFGIGLGKRVPFENALFSDPEGRSFNSKIPMPYKSGAKITITNESDRDLMLLFYDINFMKVKQHKKNVLYFHTFWNRDMSTEVGKAFQILPEVEGSGRFLGTNIGVITDPVYEDTWWGEGEVKMYLDDDGQLPTLVGTGTEDYVGTAWGQGTFDHQYQGSVIANQEKGHYAFYRYHIPDPVWFHDDIRVTIQQMGGADTDKVIELMDNGAILEPVTAGDAPDMVKLLDLGDPPNIRDSNYPGGWTNFYRSDDVSSTAYFYLDAPTSNLPELLPVDQRTKNLTEE